MKKYLRFSAAVCLSALAAGCGSIPEVLIDAAQQSAKEAVEESINEQFEELADEFLDPDQLGELFPEDENE